MTSPRRGRLGASVAQVGPASDRLDWAARAGQAFVELLEHLPTDHLHSRTSVTVVATIDQDKLRRDSVPPPRHRRRHLRRRPAPLACTRRSSRPSSTARPGSSTSAAVSGSSTARRTSRSASTTPPAPPTAANAPPPGAISTTARPGRRRTHRPPRAVPLCGFHHRRIHDPISPSLRSRRDGHVPACDREQSCSVHSSRGEEPAERVVDVVGERSARDEAETGRRGRARHRTARRGRSRG